jgi:hypothetical protein
MSKFEPISLARPDFGPPVVASESGEGLSLYVDNPCVVELPVEGEITFRYRRGPATLTEASSRGPARAAADFTLLEIVGCKEIASNDELSHETNEIDKLFETARREEREREQEQEHK